jgi:hypothetical protein
LVNPAPQGQALAAQRAPPTSRSALSTKCIRESRSAF